MVGGDAVDADAAYNGACNDGRPLCPTPPLRTRELISSTSSSCRGSLWPRLEPPSCDPAPSDLQSAAQSKRREFSRLIAQFVLIGNSHRCCGALPRPVLNRARCAHGSGASRHFEHHPDFSQAPRPLCESRLDGMRASRSCCATRPTELPLLRLFPFCAQPANAFDQFPALGI